MSRLLIALFALHALDAAQVRPAPPRPAPAPMTGTASVTGAVVTDDADARPVRRAAVTLSAPGDARRQWVTATDDNGRFAFAGLPGGNFTLYASKPGYVRAYYGANRAGSTIGVPVAVPDGRAVPDLTVKMTRGAVITGNVFDERGRPMQAVTVRVRRVTRGSDGARIFGTLPIGTGTGTSTTDDRGVYRVYGLAPGEYAVSAEPVIVRPALAGTTDTDVRQPTDAELQWAERQLRPAGSPPEPPPTAGQTITYAEVFHPGVVDQSAATPIALTAGEERSGIDLRMRFVPTARVAGAVRDRSGQPASAVRVTLLPRAAIIDEPQRQVLGDVGLITADRTATTGADGTFSLRGIEPGQYTLIARGVERGTTPATTLWATADVDVNGRDLEGVSLTLAASTAISGRVSFEGTVPPDSVRVQFRLTPAQAGLTASSTLTSLSNSAPTFTLPGVVPGRYRLAVVIAGPTAGATVLWSLKSAMVGGRDVADGVFEVRSGENPGEVVLTLSDAMASVSGVVTDAAGRSSSELSLLLFSTDRGQWFVNSRRLRAPVRAASDGRFTFTGLPAGEYYLAAVNDYEPNGWFSAEFLDQLIASAIKITVADGEKKVQDIRISR